MLEVSSPSDLSFTFTLENVPASQAAEFTLDEAQRDKLTVLAGLLGLSAGRWTPAGVLGLIFAGCGCQQMDDHPCFLELLRA